MAKKDYKPLLFTTTVRNPERFKQYLYVLNKFVGCILDDTLATKICAEAMRFGIYRPNKKSTAIKTKWESSSQGGFSDVMLSDSEVKWLLQNNPQNHKEAGFSKGWPSRFATIFSSLKQYGFAFFKPGCKVEISEIGSLLLSNLVVEVNDEGYIEVKEGNPKNDHDVFLHAMVKYHRDNPFLRVLNKNIPLVLLLQVIKLLNADSKNSAPGISRRELPLLIFWKDNNARAVYEMIMEIRDKYGYSPSPEVIQEYCIKKIMGGAFKKFDLESIVNEYPDEYIRKMRYTGLISLRGGGRFIDINSTESKKVEYILQNYSKYLTFKSEFDYYKYVSTVDKNLLGIPEEPIDENRSEELLSKWISEYPWAKVKEELLKLSSRSNSTDPILKYLDKPIRLEFLVAIAVKSQRPNYSVRPNYVCDDEGLPTSTAGGNRGDIECYGKNNFLLEVTMSEGRVQAAMEGWPVKRHLEEFSKIRKNSTCIFVAPTVFSDTKDQFEWSYDRFNLSHSFYVLFIFLLMILLFFSYNFKIMR